MLKPVVRTILEGYGEMADRLRGRCTVMLKCGHPSRRNRVVGRQWVHVHCAMCTYLSKERESKNDRRAARNQRREERKRKQQFKVERQMAKKKMASTRVVKRSKLVKKAKMRVGRKWFKPSFVFAEKGTLLQKLMTAFAEAEGQTIGENELIALMEKAGVKAVGTKTVKKQVKAALRNMFRAGVIVKDRDRENHPELSKKKDKDEDEDEDEEETTDEETTDDAEEEEEKSKVKKKVIKKK